MREISGVLGAGSYTRRMGSHGGQRDLARHISGTLAQAVGYYIGMCSDIPALIAQCDTQPTIPEGHAQLRRDALEIAASVATLRMAVREWTLAGNTWADEHNPRAALELLDIIGSCCVMVAGARTPLDIDPQPIVGPGQIMDLYEQPGLAAWEERHPPLDAGDLRAIAARFGATA